MLDRLRNLLRSPETKASRASNVLAFESGGRARWTPKDYAALSREGYLGNAIVHGAVRLIAQNAASCPLLVYEGAQERPDHPLVQLFNEPNARQDGAGFLETVYSHLLLAGNAYIECVSIDDTPRELYALRPDRMKIVPGSDGWPEAYDYAVAGRSVRFDQASTRIPSILHLTFFHPLDDHYGLAPIEAAAVAVDTHNAAARWNKALLDNAARPSGALVYSGPDGAVLSEQQFDRLKSELSSTYQGAANAGRPLLLEGGLDWKAMSLTPKDMDFLQAKHAAAREIALAFGVPPMLLGIPGDNTFANYQEANRALWRQSVLPLAARVVTSMAQWLARDAGIRVVIDTDRIDALSGDRSAHWQRIADAPFLTLNEKRRPAMRRSMAVTCCNERGIRRDRQCDRARRPCASGAVPSGRRRQHGIAVHASRAGCSLAPLRRFRARIVALQPPRSGPGLRQMDRLHSVLKSISGERKSAPDHLTVFREFISHLEKVNRASPTRNKAVLVRKKPVARKRKR
jgi:HK97 family phage portal protein